MRRACVTPYLVKWSSSRDEIDNLLSHGHDMKYIAMHYQHGPFVIAQ